MFTPGGFALSESVAPTIEPLTLTEAKLAARVTESEDDELVLAMISAARRECENELGRQLLTATYILELDDLVDRQRIPRPPMQSITLFRYKDTGGTWTTLVAGTDYDLFSRAEPAFVTPCYGTVWPTVLAHPLSVEITYVCGWTAAAQVPENIRQWIRLRVATLYEHRESFVTGTIATTMPGRFHPGLLDEHWIRDVD